MWRPPRRPPGPSSRPPGWPLWREEAGGGGTRRQVRPGGGRWEAKHTKDKSGGTEALSVVVAGGGGARKSGGIADHGHGRYLVPSGRAPTHPPSESIRLPLPGGATLSLARPLCPPPPMPPSAERGRQPPASCTAAPVVVAGNGGGGGPARLGLQRARSHQRVAATDRWEKVSPPSLPSSLHSPRNEGGGGDGVGHKQFPHRWAEPPRRGRVVRAPPLLAERGGIA